MSIGDRLPIDPARRRRVVHRFGPARPLHLGDYLGQVRRLRTLAADPMVDLTVMIRPAPAPGAEDDRADAVAHTAATLVACGLGSVLFRRGEAASEQVIDLDEAVGRNGSVVVHDLRRPRHEMGSVPDDRRGVVHLLDPPLRVAATIRATDTDLDPTLGYDPQLRPGVANLAVILGALTGRSPIAALFGLHGSSQLKRAVADAVETHLGPVRQRYADLAADPETMRRLVE